MTIAKFKNFLLLMLLFLLPYQTRLIYRYAYIGGNFWEYGSLSLYVSEILLGAIILLAIIEELKNKIFISKLTHWSSRGFYLVVSLIAMIILYLAISSDLNLAWQYLNWVIYAFCLLFIIAGSQINFFKLSLALWLGAIIPSILGIWQFLSLQVLPNKWLGIASQNPAQIGAAVIEFGGGRWLRAYGSFGWPNSLAIYLGAIFLLGIILIMLNKSRKWQIGLLLGQIIIISALFFTFARGAFLGAAVGGLILLIKYRKNILFYKQIVIYLLLVLILSISFKNLLVARADFTARLERRSITERATQWQDFKNIFAKKFVVGTGPGNYPVNLRQLHPDFSVNYFTPIHNIYLLYLGQFGLVGAILLCLVIYLSKQKINWLFAPLVGILVAGLFDHWSLSMFSGWIFLAVILALSAFKLSYEE